MGDTLYTFVDEYEYWRCIRGAISLLCWVGGGREMEAEGMLLKGASLEPLPMATQRIHLYMTKPK